MNRTAHKNFATTVLGVSEKSYDDMNAKHEAKNAAIRAARAEWEDALMNGTRQDIDKKAAALDKVLGL